MILDSSTDTASSESSASSAPLDIRRRPTLLTNYTTEKTINDVSNVLLTFYKPREVTSTASCLCQYSRPEWSTSLVSNGRTRYPLATGATHQGNPPPYCRRRRGGGCGESPDGVLRLRTTKGEFDLAIFNVFVTPCFVSTWDSYKYYVRYLRYVRYFTFESF
jgi:hypothetical protein